MDFSGMSDHRHHHHSRREDDEAEGYPPPPSAPTFYADQPPPTHVSHSSHLNYPTPPPSYPPPPQPHDFPPPIAHPPPPIYGNPPPPPSHYYGQLPQPATHDLNPTYPPPSHAASVQHVSHSVGGTERHDELHRPHLPSFVHHHTHTIAQDVPSDPLVNKPTFRVFCKVKDEYSLSIHEGMVVLARSDHRDHLQYWIKDEKYSTRVKDKEEFPSFALVNKATGQAIKHSIGNSHPVQLINHNPEAFDESILWSESRDLGDGFRTIRMVNNIQLNFTVSKDKWHGGVREGTPVVLGDWKKGDNQRWKIIPY